MRHGVIALALWLLLASTALAQVSRYVGYVPNATTGTLDVSGAGDSSLTVGAFTRRWHLSAGAIGRGSTAPTDVTMGTAQHLCFDADAELAYFVFEVPTDWDGVSDMNLVVEWAPESGAALANTETVIWTTDYRAVADGEAMTNGTLVTATSTYTQSGAGTDMESIHSATVLDFDHANQPLTAGDHVFFELGRDMTTDTYGSDACAHEWMVEYESTGLATGGA